MSETDVKPIWYEYATFDNDGFVNGIRNDAPEDVKEAYRKEQKQDKEYEEEGKKVPR